MLEKTITVNELKIAYKEWLPKHDSSTSTSNTLPIVCIHGWLDNAASFDLLLPFFNEYRCLAIDLPGHGLSEHLPTGAYYHFIDGITQLLDVLDALTIKRCILVGHSLGACLVSMLAGAAPERISKLILLDGLGPITSNPQHALINYTQYLHNLTKIRRKIKRNYPTFEKACQHRAQQGYLNTELTTIIARRALKKTEHGYQWRHDPRLLVPSPLRFTEQQALSFLNAITAPTCLLKASKGFKFDEGLFQQRVNAISKLILHTLECGHHLHLEQPKHCARFIKEFLNREV